MLDVHPPHAPTHTWKDFFIHIATIVVGLLIAVGLEQTVEAIHRHNERVELRESLQHESAQVLLDTARVEAAETAEIRWQKEFGDLFITSARAHKPLGTIPPHPKVDFDIPDNPIYRVARTGTKLPLLTPREAEAYNELDALLIEVVLAYRDRRAALNAEDETLTQLAFSQPAYAARTNGVPDPAAMSGLTLSPDELRQWHQETVHAATTEAHFRTWSRAARGAALALSHGERDLPKLQAAERQFLKLP